MTVRDLIQHLLLTSNLDDEVFIQGLHPISNVEKCKTSDRHSKEWFVPKEFVLLNIKEYKYEHRTND